MPPEKPKNTTLKVTSAVIVTLAVVMLLIASNVTKTQQAAQSVITTPIATTAAPTATTATTATTQSTTSSSTASSSGYKDGTYTASTDYYIPRGSEQIQVSLTIKNGIVTDSSIVNSEGDRQSAQYQQAFASSYKSHVTGKSISSLELSYVAGASDTTQGFNDAVSQIQTEAKA
ncbi:MAG TPA: hypothetical protein VIM31_03710 [Candidatus Microsaccharimonas sp.]|jgi:uncharacterized protein with FMN-binding domain